MIRLVTCLVLAGVLGTAGQQRFRTGVEAVRVDVLVTDGSRPVTGLAADDFDLRDTGIEQTVDSITLADVPISMMLALDTSASVAGATLEQLKGGVLSALAMLQPQDRAALVTFSSDVRLAHDWSGDISTVTRAVADFRGAGGTALWDATFTALTLGDPSPTVRRLILIFSDGDDTGSWLTRQAVIEKAKRTDAVLYGISLSGLASQTHGATLMGRSGIELSPNEPPVWLESRFLADVAEATGGTEHIVGTSRGLRATFEKIVNEFRTRYVLTYTPHGVETSGWHPLEVKLKTKRGTVRARRGYSR
jgi:Ca-activated chloride channel family protein